MENGTLWKMEMLKWNSAIRKAFLRLISPSSNLFLKIQKCKFYIFLTNVNNVIGSKTTGHFMERELKTKFQGYKIDSNNSFFYENMPVSWQDSTLRGTRRVPLGANTANTSIFFPPSPLRINSLISFLSTNTLILF